MRKIYYAHAICLYDEADDQRQLTQIRRRFRRSTIVNPARYDGHPEKQIDTVGFCLNSTVAM